MLVNLHDVRHALEKEAVVPCFQPIVELRTGNLAGFEVLARWQHPSLGLILPENFITLAEENGLIGELTHQILRKSFLAASALPELLAFSGSQCFADSVAICEPAPPDLPCGLGLWFPVTTTDRRGYRECSSQ